MVQDFVRSPMVTVIGVLTMAHFLCHRGAHILELFCSTFILPKTHRGIAYENKEITN